MIIKDDVYTKLYLKFKKIINLINKYVYVKIPDNIQLVFERCGSRKFPTMDSSGLYIKSYNTIFMNLDWSILHINDEYESIIFHELRHVVQFVLIDKYLNGEKVKDVSKDIELWIKNKDNYIKYNKYDELEKQITYYLQPLELDAYAFTIAVFNLEDLDIYLRLPEEISSIIENKAREIYNLLLPKK